MSDARCIHMFKGSGVSVIELCLDLVVCQV